MKFEIHSFESIQKRAEEKFPENTMLISIGDPDAPPPKLLHKPKFLLRLVFDDITPEDAVERLELPEYILNEPEKLQIILEGVNTVLFTDEMAEKTASFIKEHIADTELFICHCQYGQSRSAAVAAAVAEYFGGMGIVIFKDERYYPNKLVYRKLMEAFDKVMLKED